MSKEIIDKPFWLKPPWMILFDLVKLHRIRPWDVNISYLLNTLIGEMMEKGFIDFTASGIALFSSAIIFRMKSSLVLEMQDPPKAPTERIMEDLPPPIQLPYRHEYTATTIENLIKSLENVLKEEPLQIKPRLVQITPTPPLIQELDQFMVDIEENIEKMYQNILHLVGEDEVVPFSRITLNQNKMGIIRSFLLVLFIASRGMIRLWQDEEFGEIYLSIVKGFPIP